MFTGTLLEILRTTDGIKLRVRSSLEADESTPWSEIELRQKTLDEIQRLISQLPQTENLLQCGQALYSQLFANNLSSQERLRNLHLPVFLVTNWGEVPWELLHDGEDFLGSKYPIGRFFPNGHLPTAPVDRVMRIPPGILILDNRENAPATTRQEEKNSFTLPVDIISGRELTKTRLIDRLSQARHAVIYYRGAVAYNAARQSGNIPLPHSSTEKGAETVSIEEIFTSLNGHPLVLLETNCTESYEQWEQVRSALESLAYAFWKGGAATVITWLAFDETNWVEPLLSKLSSGISLGEGMRQIRFDYLPFADQPTSGGIPRAFVVLYGDPAWQLWLSASLFLESGSLDRSRFAPSALEVLDRAVEAAREVNAAFLGASHFISAMLQTSRPFQQALLSQGCDIQELIVQVRSLMRSGRGQSVSLLQQNISEHLRSVLETADQLSQGQPIDDVELMLAYLQNPEAHTSSLLHDAGVDVNVLRETLSATPVEGQSSMDTNHGNLFWENGQINRDWLAPSALQTLELAANEAQGFGQLVINTAHVFIALTKTSDSVTARGLQAQNLPPNEVRLALRVMLRQQPKLDQAPPLNKKSFSTNVQTLLHTAASYARQPGQAPELIDDRHLLIGFLLLKDSSTSQALQAMGVQMAPLIQVAGLDAVLASEVTSGGAASASARGASATPILDQLGRDLTKMAREGKLYPVEGRKDEMQRLVQILCRQQKNNAILVGEAGVGKTSIVEGLAQRIVAKKVPTQLQDKRLVEIPVASLVAGTQYRGQFEERLTGIMREANQSGVILFFDEIHTLVGAGQASGGSLDAGNIFKPALARGELHCIGATTPEEYGRSIEKDSALERRFQTVNIPELGAEATLHILQSLQPRFEAYYKVTIQPEALQATVRLSSAYLPHRHQPDKSIDLLEETCARASLRGFGSSAGDVPPPSPEEPAIVAPDNIAQVLAQMTGLPVGGLSEGEGEKLADLESRLSKVIIGQPAAISSVAHTLRVGRSGLRTPNRPLGVLLFVGPSGVGKTALAYAVALEAFGSAESIFRLDMSEFTESHSVAKLIGSPPGYVGYEREGMLTGHLRRCPRGVVLLDEIEKAHPDIFDLLLQLFDAGRITDTQGRTASGENSLFIMTSNVTFNSRQRQQIGFIPAAPVDEQLQNLDAMRDALGETFRPEFLNRLDDIIVFQALDAEACCKIVRLKLEEVRQRAAGIGLRVTFTDSAVQLVADKGFSAEFGARHLQRTIDLLISRPLSELIVRKTQGSFLCQAKGDQLTFTTLAEPVTD